ncbi:RCC1 domain-containing protein, partial [Arthrobacter alkaliphilus]
VVGGPGSSRHTGPEPNCHIQLDLFQFDLDGTITVNLGASISGQGQCVLTLPEAKTHVPAGELGYVALSARPTLTLEVTGTIAMNTSITLKCGAEYRWNAGAESRTKFCSTTSLPLALTSSTGVEAKATAAINLGVALDDIVGITGQLNAAIDTNYTPTTHPIATIDATAGYELGACLACFWSGSPAHVTMLTGTFFTKRIATYDTPPPPPPTTTGPLTITTTSLPTATTGIAYRATLTATGGTGPYTWAITTGTLPPGLTLEPTNGTITGVPTNAGTSNLTITTTDNARTAAATGLAVTVAPPPNANALTNIAAVVGGYGNAYALKNDGTVWSWGNNNGGALGDGTTTSHTLPAPVPGLANVTQVAATGSDTYALESDGSLWAWGSNTFGEIGDGTTTPRLTPVKVLGLPRIKAIYAGSANALAQGADGSVWAWGKNGFGELGDGTTVDRHQPVTLSLTNVKALAVGAYMNGYALKNDGTVWAWGTNYAGQLGNGTASGGSYNGTPAQVQGLTGVTSIAAGTGSAFAIRQDGTVWAWGDNSVGRLGDGTTTNRALPVQLPGLSQVTSIAPGSYGDVFAIRSDRSVWGWGANAYGALFDPPTSPTRLLPGPIPSLTGAVSISAGGYASSYLIKQDGTAWAWGYNYAGQLGDGTTVDRYKLIPIGAQG